MNAWKTGRMKVFLLPWLWHVMSIPLETGLISSPAAQNGRHFASDIFRCILVNEMFILNSKLNLKSKFHKICFQGPKWELTSTGLDNSRVPNRRQAIIWTNADPVHWRIYAALGGTWVNISSFLMSYTYQQLTLQLKRVDHYDIVIISRIVSTVLFRLHYDINIWPVWCSEFVRPSKSIGLFF